MKKRVAIIIPGGVGAGLFNQGVPALVQLIEGLSKQNELTVYSLGDVSSDYLPKGFHLKTLAGFRSNWSTARVFRLARLIYRDHRAHRFDIFHGFWGIPCGSIAVILGKLLRKPSIVSLQGGETASIKSINYGYLLNNRKKRRLLTTLNSASKVTVLTNYQKELLKKTGYSSDNVEVIPFGVDTAIFKPKEQVIGEPLRFIHIANLTEVKDQITLLKTFKSVLKYKKAELRIIGADQMNGKLQQMSKELGLNSKVTFLGPVRHSTLPEQLNWAHILLHTSLYESQAVVVAEAMASNVLVAGTKVGLISDLSDAVVSCEAGNHEKLAELLLQELSQPELINQKRKKGLVWAREHDINFTIRAFSKCYDKLINS